jgi:hypothetical protein
MNLSQRVNVASCVEYACLSVTVASISSMYCALVNKDAFMFDKGIALGVMSVGVGLVAKYFSCMKVDVVEISSKEFKDHLDE